MIELKVQCDCGQKFKFDVEPVNGRMPFEVKCPGCGADGTEKANTLIQQILPGQVGTPPPAPAPAPLRIRINTPASAAAPPPIAPVSDGMPPSSRQIAGLARLAVTGKQEPSGRKPSFGMGLLGGLIGALIGATIYFLVFKYTGLRFKLLAVGVGALAGWGAELMGKGEGSKELGGITAVLVLVGVIGAQYFVALGWWHEFSPTKLADSVFMASVDESKEVVKAIPTGSDAEIQNYLAKAMAEDNEKVNPSSISNEEVKEFREKQLPEYRELASGKLTKEQYYEKHGLDSKEQQKLKDTEGNTFQGIFLLLLLSKTSLFSLAAAAGLAFKMSTNA